MKLSSVILIADNVIVLSISLVLVRAETVTLPETPVNIAPRLEEEYSCSSSALEHHLAALQGPDLVILYVSDNDSSTHNFLRSKERL